MKYYTWLAVLSSIILSVVSVAASDNWYLHVNDALMTGYDFIANGLTSSTEAAYLEKEEPWKKRDDDNSGDDGDDDDDDDNDDGNDDGTDGDDDGGDGDDDDNGEDDDNDGSGANNSHGPTSKTKAKKVMSNVKQTAFTLSDYSFSQRHSTLSTTTLTITKTITSTVKDARELSSILQRLKTASSHN